MEPIQSGQEEDLPRSQDLEELLADAREDAGVLAVLLYGSAARGEATSSSDLDVCLVLSPDLEPDEPAALSRKRIDYVGRHRLDVTIFRQLPLYVRRRVLREGRVLSATESMAAAQASGDRDAPEALKTTRSTSSRVQWAGVSRPRTDGPDHPGWPGSIQSSTAAPG